MLTSTNMHTPRTRYLYKGMSENELTEYFEKIGIRTDSLDYKICKLCYVNRYTEVKVANMVAYSVENIKKKKRSINDKIKEFD